MSKQVEKTWAFLVKRKIEGVRTAFTKLWVSLPGTGSETNSARSRQKWYKHKKMSCLILHWLVSHKGKNRAKQVWGENAFPCRIT